MIDLNITKLLDYDPKTGIFVWLTRPVRSVYERTDHTWNTRYAGKLAGCVVRWGDRLRYLSICINGKRYQAHRLAYLYMTGEFPPDQIDHKDCNGLNNRWSNLRRANASQNGGNSGIRVNNTSGFKGVSFDKSRRRYIAHIRVYGNLKYLGRFDTPKAAHIAYVEAAKKHFGEFSRIA